MDLDGEYPFELSEYNALSLKNVHVCINGKDLFEGDAVQADEVVRKHYSLPLHSGEMLQPWFKRKFDPTYMQGRDKITLTYTFTVKTLPRALYLAYEGDYDVTVNGSTVRKTGIFWKDVCFTVVQIQGKTGENTVKLAKNFAECDDVENVYILGDFGIDENCAVTDLPTLLRIADVNKCLPHYAGEVRFTLGEYENIQSRHKRLPREICAKLITNDGEQYICNYPYTATVTNKTPVTLAVVLGAENLFCNKRYKL